MRRDRVRWLVLAAAACAATSASAQGVSGERPTQIWLNPGSYSLHFDRGKNLREDNFGVGAEVVLSEAHAMAAGSFVNSNNVRSRYGAWYWRPLHWRTAGLALHGGVAVGAFDGYPNYRNGAWFPAALPVLAVEGERFGVNIFVVPTIRNRLDGALALQFKFRVW